LTLALAEVFSFEALWQAVRRTARGKRGSPGVANFRLELEPRILALQRLVLAGEYRPDPVMPLRIHDPKRRVISVPSVRDRVVQQCLAAVLGPRIERRLIGDTYACRVGHGTHAAMRRARAWARTYRWHLRLDVTQFFPTIDHAVVRAQLARDLPRGALRELCEIILDASGTFDGPYLPGDDLFSPRTRRVGLPLGSLTSQLWANRYLDPIDHLVKDRLRHRAYLRYMDDMLLFDDDRARLEALGHRLEAACFDLRLRLHRWCVMPTAPGVGFVGYRLLPRIVRVKRSSVGRAERRLRGMLRHDGDPRRVMASLRSSMAHWAHADGWRLTERVLRRLGLLYIPGPVR
jgi:retron-type reverse transcriptase